MIFHEHFVERMEYLSGLHVLNWTEGYAGEGKFEISPRMRKQ